MIDNLKDAIEEYKDYAECETETARVLRNVGNEKDAKYFEETAENDKQIAGFLEELKARREEDRWIPVSERLPEYSDNYLVFVDDGYIDIGVYHSDKEEWSLCDAHGFYWAKNKGVGIIAWKPLPEPYESEAENE